MPVSCFWVWQKSPAPGGPFLISAAHRMWCSGSPLVPEAENRWYVGSLSRSSPVSPLSYPHHEAGSYGQVPSVRSLLSAGSGVYSCRSESPTALSSVPWYTFWKELIPVLFLPSYALLSDWWDQNQPSSATWLSFSESSSLPGTENSRWLPWLFYLLFHDHSCKNGLISVLFSLS